MTTDTRAQLLTAMHQIDSAEMFVNQAFWNISIQREDMPASDGYHVKSIVTRLQDHTGKYIKTNMIPNAVKARRDAMHTKAAAEADADWRATLEPETNLELAQAAGRLFDDTAALPIFSGTAYRGDFQNFNPPIAQKQERLF